MSSPSLVSPSADPAALAVADRTAPSSLADARTAPSSLADARLVLDRVLARRWTLFAVLVVLNLADVVLTQIGLGRGAVERNPLMVQAVQSWGGAVAAKALCLAAAALVLVSGPRRSRVLDLGLLACVCWYVGVVCWNLNVISNQG